MKRKITLLMMAALLAVGGVQAKTTVRTYFRVGDSHFSVKFWPYWEDGDGKTGDVGTGWKYNSYDAKTQQIYLDKDASAGGWSFATPIDFTQYSKLVVKIVPKSVTSTKDGAEWYQGVCMYIDKNEEGEYCEWFNLADNNEDSYYTREIDLTATLKKGDNHDGDNSDLTSVNRLRFRTNVDGLSFRISELYLEKEVTADYQELGEYTYGTLRATHGYVTTTSGAEENYSFGWQYNDGTDWSNYKYLVVVPKKEYIEGQSGAESTEGTTIPIQMFGYNKSGEGFGDAIDLGWIGEWNPTRAKVIDLTAMTGLDLSNIGKLRIYTNTYFGEWGLSAAYLTNTAPTWKNGWDDEVRTVANHYRTSSTANTYGTICLPYNAAVCGAEVFEVVGVDSKDTPSELYLEQVDGILTAGKAYIFKTNSTLNVTFYRVGANEVGFPTGNNLIGTFYGATVPEGSYILVNTNEGPQWKKVVAETPKTVGANRAYLTLTESLVVPDVNDVKSYIRMDLGNDEVTGLNTIANVQSTIDNAIYDLSGRRVSKPTKGLYVKNGKKIIIK